MKKVLLVTLSLCMLVSLLCVSAFAASENYGKSYRAPYGTPAVDGTKDAVWNLADWESVNVNSASHKAKVRFKVLHDDYLIYVLAEYADPMVSTKHTECLHFKIHAHTCADADTCTNFETMYMGISGGIWHEQLAQSYPTDNYKVLKSQSADGTVYTMEWSFAPDTALPKNSSTAYGLEFMVDDYQDESTWLSAPQTWNSYNSTASRNAGNFGELYFLTQAETGEVAASASYNDVPETHYAYDAITYTSSQGLFVPASPSNPSFYPDMNLTRAQFVTLLGRLAEVNTASYTSTTFTDVNFARDKWFAPYAEWARVKGLVVGSSFMANKTITVSEAVVMLQRYAEHLDDKYVPTNIGISGYTDTATVPTWAQAAMRWAVNSNVYMPLGKTLNPSGIVNRAMAAQLIYRYETVLSSGISGIEPGVSVMTPPSNIDWDRVKEINALEFGFVNDGKTFNDAIMSYYIEHYSHTTPLYFPAGTYAFRNPINFPTRVYLELSPGATLILMSETVQDYFITLQKGMNEWGSWDNYAMQSYIKGGTINANYCAKTALGLHGGLHTRFADFQIRNVLEKGLQTEINELANGAYAFENILFYNDAAIADTIAIYDNSADNLYEGCTAVNFQTFINTGGGKFTECSGWFNNYGKDLIKDSVYAVVRTGNQSVFNTPLVDTYRTGFKMVPTALVDTSTGNTNYHFPTTSITNMIWITNNTFYTQELQQKYPMIIFDVPTDLCKVMVDGMYIPWRQWGDFRFSNIPLPSSSFLNVRYEQGYDPWNHMENFRDDTDRLRAGKGIMDFSDKPSHNAWHAQYNQKVQAYISQNGG